MQKRKEVADRKQDVYQAMIEIIAQRGFSAVSTLTVSQHLGVSQPAIYKYFKNRDDMILGFLDYMTGLLGVMIEQINAGRSLSERIRLFYQVQFRTIEETQILPRVLFFEELQLDDGDKKKKLKALIDKFDREISGMLREGLQQEQRVIKEIEPLLEFLKGSILSYYLTWIMADKSYSLVGKIDGLMHFVERTFLL